MEILKIGERMRATKIVEFSGKKYRITELAATEARRIQVQYGASFESGNYALNEELSRLLLSHVEVAISEPGKGEFYVKLESEELINQHVSPRDILKLEGEVLNLSLGFSEAGEA